MDYHSHIFHDYSLMVYKKNKLVGLLPANLVDSTLYSHQGLSYGSLIYSKTLKTTEFIQIWRSVLEFLNTEEIQNIQIKELPNFYLYNQSNNPLAYMLFKSKAELLRTDLHSVVDMKYKAYSNSRKEGVKRAVRANLKVEESHSLEGFWELILTPNLESKHGVKPVHSLKEITLLKSRFNTNIRQFNVYKDNKIVAGTTIFETENIAHCQYISGNSEKNELGSLDFLFHHLIENVFNEKIYFDFGTSNINEGQHINEGLLFWKEGFGARSMPQGFYNIATENYNLLEDVLI
ncbi:acetyltransferase (GNAT) family protein [Winogradskyella epiphytica]|uniref:Acetyltransferase (GNAT) family protein n=1 Tax=Winogradskyella epiphytica TaxID=262005 RepID=A0A2V4YAT6_9FLAO|nr:GNAT family N-acetyltransferase [Winogradskyella epiphytica]PYE80123.1 acetyltransferase (GNAT) family protein [Winogradskyella epiphytica]